MERFFITIAALLFLEFFTTCNSDGKSIGDLGKRPDSPNIILIMADDLGWGDVGFNGNKLVKTPALDEMAKRGMAFTRFYAAAPVCSPTRGSCLTGRHPFRYGVFHANVGKMEPEEVTLAEYLKEKGYSTGHFGKWHLGTLTNNIIDANRGGRDSGHYSPPWENGFDVCFSTESKVPTWNPMITPGKDAGDIGNRKPGNHFGTYYWSGPGVKVTHNLEGDDSRIIMDRVIPYIEEQTNGNSPFLAVIWFHTPHLPVLSGEKYRNLYAEYNVDVQHYYGSISAMDEQIGRLNEKLEELNATENTLIFFTSDNGPEGTTQEGRTQGSTGGFKGRKRNLYEGGIRVPAIAVWPAEIKAGQQTDFPAVTSDYFPTLLEIFGEKNQLPVSPLDGVSLVDVWDEKIKERTTPIGFQFGEQKALIDNQYKIYTRKDEIELYDLLEDPFETRDISNQNPAKVNEMKIRLSEFVRSCEKSMDGADYD
jgi:arylsulfatase A-like enzyme